MSKRHGRPAGRPTLDSISAVIDGRPHVSWLPTVQDEEYLINLMACGLPRQVILGYMEERGVKVGGVSHKLGQQLQVLSTFATSHRDEIVQARDIIKAESRLDALDRRAEFLHHLYAARDTLYDRMLDDRDVGGRPSLVRECREYDELIARVEGFDRSTADAGAARALEKLVGLMFGAKEAPVLETEVTVLESAALPLEIS